MPSGNTARRARVQFRFATPTRARNYQAFTE